MTLPTYDDHPMWRRYQPHFPPAMQCTRDSTPTEAYWRWRGLDVHLDRLAVPSSPFKVIVLHGAGAYGRVMAPAAVLAQRYGYETVTPDLPGYGLTRVPWRDMSYPLWIDCVCDLIDAELARDGRPVVLFGVSLGGLLAYQAAARSRRVIGLVATTLADTREPRCARASRSTRCSAPPGCGCCRASRRSPTGCRCRWRTSRRWTGSRTSPSWPRS